MAKSGVFERDPTDNLKKELQKLVKTIVEDSSDDEIVDKTVQILQSLKQGFNIIHTGKILMILLTYDRVSIQKWLSRGKKTCFLSCRHSIETRTNAAATLFTLSALDSNKLVIRKAATTLQR
ncbi:hypothetical protein Hanom_Chr05g00389461 [Helianthus anomalus]